MNLKKLNDIPPWDWPENAETIVIETLTNRNASKEDRLLAADLAGDYTILSEKIASMLLSIVSSKEEASALRSKAAISLGPGLEEADTGDYDDPNDPPALSMAFVQNMQRTLHNLYSDADVPKEVRRSILEASVRNPQAWHEGAIRSAYDSKDEEWRLTAAFCMCYVKGFDSQILEALKSSNPDVKYHAVNAAGNWEIDAAWPYVARLVTSAKTDKPMLLAAIKAAALIRPHETEIIEPHVDSYDEDISETAMEALSEAGFIAGFDSDEYEDDEEDDDFEVDEEDEDYDDEEDFDEEEEVEDEDDEDDEEDR